VPVEPGSPLVGAADMQVHTTGAVGTKGSEQGFDQPAPEAAALQPRQQVDMQVGRVAAD